MAVSDEQIAEKKARNEENAEEIARLKREIAQAEAAEANNITADDLDRENAVQQAEIARLQAAAAAINGQKKSPEPAEAEKPKAKTADNATVSGDQRNPTNFSGKPAEGKE
ncbi:hypothetical protein SEA_JUMBO_17 [Gordonia phage Jumbo]|uniref:Uncharacterized protein n=1 Tax=Gordonia phage Jumbo TaxID=1887650 RepID=A0A1B3B0H4_9CAUD|nr:hypothetical protein BIZ69_gp017 [Gordonia phage Jumbo]AOE44530.1 hypothetical protein SEA_JUMBO_17 [Gordonia phage Jumbo]